CAEQGIEVVCVGDGHGFRACVLVPFRVRRVEGTSAVGHEHRAVDRFGRILIEPLCVGGGVGPVRVVGGAGVLGRVPGDVRGGGIDDSAGVGDKPAVGVRLSVEVIHVVVLPRPAVVHPAAVVGSGGVVLRVIAGVRGHE